MAISSTLNSSGTYDIYNNGVKVSTGTKQYVDSLASSPISDITPPKVPTVINSSNIAPATPITLPSVSQYTTNYTGVVDNGNSIINANNQSLSQNNQSPTELTPYEKLLASKLQIPQAPAGSLETYNTAYNSQINPLQSNLNEKAQAVKTAQSKLSSINAELAGINAEAQAQQLKLEKDAVSTGNTSSGFLNRQQQEITRQAAIKALPLQAQAIAAQAEVASAQGDAQSAQDLLTQATNHLDRLFSLQQQDAQNQYKYQTDLYNSIKSDLTAAENRRLDELKTKNAQDFQLKQDAINNAQELAKVALSNGQSDIYSQITALNPDSPTYQQDVARLGGQIQTGNTLDDQYKKLQIAKLKQDLQNNGLSSQDAQTMIAYANQYASTGSIPVGLPKGTLGTVAQLAKELPKTNGEIVDNNTNIRSGKITSSQIDAYGALRDLILKIDDAKALFDKLNTGLVGGTLGNVFPSQDRQAYETLRGEIVDLLARARTGAAISASEEALYKDKIPGTFNQTFGIGTSGSKKLEGLKSSISGKLESQLKANGASMYGFSKIKLSDGKEYTVGDIITVGEHQGRVNPDGTITQIN